MSTIYTGPGFTKMTADGPRIISAQDSKDNKCLEICFSFYPLGKLFLLENSGQKVRKHCDILLVNLPLSTSCFWTNVLVSLPLLKGELLEGKHPPVFSTVFPEYSTVYRVVIQ